MKSENIAQQKADSLILMGTEIAGKESYTFFNFNTKHQI